MCYVPAATTGTPPKGDEKEVGQIPTSYLSVVGSSIVIMKNQLVFFKLNNGARGTVIAHLFAPGTKPPEMPLAVVAEFPAGARKRTPHGSAPGAHRLCQSGFASPFL